MQKHRQVFDRTPYIHMAGNYNEAKRKYEYLRPFVRIWQAITPAGRQSVYFHSESYRVKPTGNNPVFTLPALRLGYVWAGPFSYSGFTDAD